MFRTAAQPAGAPLTPLVAVVSPGRLAEVLVGQTTNVLSRTFAFTFQASGPRQLPRCRVAERAFVWKELVAPPGGFLLHL